jgi:hypothetical protein
MLTSNEILMLVESRFISVRTLNYGSADLDISRVVFVERNILRGLINSLFLTL